MICFISVKSFTPSSKDIIYIAPLNCYPFTAWKSMDDIYRDAMHGVSILPQLEILIKGLFNKDTLLDFLRFFIVFDKSKTEDESGQTIVKLTKKNCRLSSILCCQ